MTSKEPDGCQETLDFEIVNLVEFLESYDNFFTGKVNANRL